MLNEKRLSALNDELKTGNEELQKLKAEHTEKQSAQSDIKKKIVGLGEEIKTLSHDVESLEREIVSIATKHNDLNRDVSTKEKLLDKDRRECEIQSLFEEQPSFWDQLEKRIEHHQSELNDGFHIFDKPIASEKVAKKFREIAVESKTFSPLAGELRSGMGAYENYMKGICEKQLDGQAITPQEKRQRLTILDGCLLNRDVEPHWG